MSADGKTVEVRPATLALPFGVLDVAFDPARLRWREYTLIDFVPVAELEVVGLPTVHRWPGLGAPLAAGIASETPVAADLLAPRARYPVTALLLFPDIHAQLHGDRIQSTLEVYPGFGEQSVTIDGRPVPLEAEPTAALALGLDNPALWARERAGFLRGMGVITEQTRLVSLRPYTPGLIPVVFVHGTASSAGRWAEIYNELDNDPRIHDRYQFWSFSYETGNPIAYSAMLLRESLEHAVARVDPEGRDPALRQMVIIGHSQGGLLTKAMVVEPGTALWNNISKEPIEKLDVQAETRDLLRRALLFHPLPFVRRVVFIATPHRGSYVAGNWLAHQVARLVSFPVDLTSMFTDLVVRNEQALALGELRPKGLPSSVNNMTPGNPFVKTMAELPIAPGVAAHSIIAAKDDRPPLDHAEDGVVAYKSAHLEGVDSECVVRSSHSCQSNPHTITEVRRILLLHLETAGAAGLKPPPPIR
jgi:pimeloyl-ACP methyl ester carboxylesterase